MKRRLLIGFLLSLLLLPLFLYWAGMKTLETLLEGRREIAGGYYRGYGVRFHADLSFSADSIEAAFPAAAGRARGLRGEIRLFSGALGFSPALDLEVDSAAVSLAPSRRSRREIRLRDSAFAFPDLRLPFKARAAVSRLGLFRGPRPLASLREVEVRLLGHERVRAAIGEASLADAAGAAAGFGLEADLEWMRRARIAYTLRVRRGDDALFLEGWRSKKDLLRGGDSLRLSLDSLASYAALSGSPAWKKLFAPPGAPSDREAALNRLGGRLEARLLIDSGFSLEGRLEAFHAHLPRKLADLRGHSVARFRLRDRAGKWSLEAKGLQGAEIYLQGPVSGLPRLDSVFPPPSFREANGRLSGYIRRAEILLADKQLPLDLELKRLDWKKESVTARARTRGGSEIEGWAGFEPRFRAGFTARIDPREPWAHAWTDSQVAFRKARGEGEFAAGRLRFSTWAEGAEAYGAFADSLFARHAVGAHEYVLETARIHGGGRTFLGSGRVEWGSRPPGVPPTYRRPLALRFEARNPEAGSAVFAMPRRRAMQVEAEGLKPALWPYRFERLSRSLAGLGAHAPELDGTFAWDRGSGSGEADLGLRLHWRGQKLESALRSDWDTETLRLREAALVLGSSSISGRGKAALGGLPFYRLGALPFSAYDSLALKAEGVEVGRLSALSLKGPSPVEGLLDGDMAYDRRAGLRGGMRWSKPRVAALQGKVELSDLVVEGRGEGVTVRFQSRSRLSPFLEDSIHLRIDSLLAAHQRVELRVRNPMGLEASFAGRTAPGPFLEGELQVMGKVLLPGKTGFLSGISAAGRASLPLSLRNRDSLQVAIPALRARYEVQGFPAQRIEAGLALRGGHLEVTRLFISDSLGQAFEGTGSYDGKEEPAARFQLAGNGLSLGFAEKSRLALKEIRISGEWAKRGLSLRLLAGSAGLQGAFPPLRVEGTLTGLRASYFHPGNRTGPGTATASPSPAWNGTPALEVKGTLQDFRLDHRVRTLKEFQEFYRSLTRKRPRRRVKPLELDIAVETKGSQNRVETDFLRFFFVGDLRLRGNAQYPVLTGSVNSLQGELGQKGQAYTLREMEARWQDQALEAGSLVLEAEKRLARNCSLVTLREGPYCMVFLSASGSIADPKLSPSDNCGSAGFGEGANLVALVNSARRGCYSPEFSEGGGSTREAFVSLIEPALSENLNSVLQTLSYRWIASTQVTGLGSRFSSDQALVEPIAVAVESREFWRIKVSGKSGYRPEEEEEERWEHRVGVEWSPPVDRFVADSLWKRRLRNRVRIEASAETNTEENRNPETAPTKKQVGILYRYRFWKLW